jgi:hypothetical protein
MAKNGISVFKICNRCGSVWGVSKRGSVLGYDASDKSNSRVLAFENNCSIHDLLSI